MTEVQHEQSPVNGAEAAMAVGAELRRAREARGETSADVAQALKLTGRQVEAMEAGKLELLPGAAFARGFLRNYARHLGLDPVALLSCLEPPVPVRAVELAPVSNAEGVMPARERAGLALRLPLFAVVVALLVFAAGWYFDWFRLQQDGELEPEPGPVVMAPVVPAPSEPGTVAVLPPPLPGATEPSVAPAAEGAAPAIVVPEPAAVAPPPVAAAAAPVPPSASLAPIAPPPAAVSAPTPAAVAAEAVAPPTGVDHLQFRFAGQAWIEVRDAGGAIVYSGMNPAGTSRTVQGRAPFALVIGNAREVALEFRGKPYDLSPHIRVSVARLKLE